MKIIPSTLKIATSTTKQITVTEVKGTLTISNSSADIQVTEPVYDEESGSWTLSITSGAVLGDYNIKFDDDGLIPKYLKVTVIEGFSTMTQDGSNTTVDDNVFSRQYIMNQNLQLVYSKLNDVEEQVIACLALAATNQATNLTNLGVIIATLNEVKTGISNIKFKPTIGPKS